MGQVVFGRAMITAVGLFVITACASSQYASSLAGTPWPLRQAALSELQSWQVMGRISVTTEEEGWHASVNWVQRGSSYSIDLIGPLGQGRVRIWGDDQGVQLRTADGRLYTASSPERLLQQTLGTAIPIEGLIYWVRGLPDPRQPVVLQGDPQGRLTHLEQRGWSIDYLRYSEPDQLARWDLPTRIRARQNGLMVKLLINRWDLDQTSVPAMPI